MKGEGTPLVLPGLLLRNAKSAANLTLYRPVVIIRLSRGGFVSSTRDQIIEATAGLLETQGYRATGLNQIIEESGAPKGSLYYYFPGGKEEFSTEASAR